MPDKAILCYICSWSLVYSLVHGSVPGNSGASGWLILLFLGVANPLSSFRPLSNSSTGDFALSSMSAPSPSCPCPGRLVPSYGLRQCSSGAASLLQHPHTRVSMGTLELDLHVIILVHRQPTEERLSPLVMLSVSSSSHSGM